MSRPTHRASGSQRKRISLLVLGVVALLMPAGFILSGPAVADGNGNAQDTCDKLAAGYTKIDKEEGSFSGAFGSFAWGGATFGSLTSTDTTLSYDLNSGYTAEFCLKSSTDIVHSGERTGTGTVGTGTEHNISHIGYIITGPSDGEQDCTDEEYAEEHPDECDEGDGDQDCTDADYAAAHPDECDEGGEDADCTDADYAAAHPDECDEGGNNTPDVRGEQENAPTQVAGVQQQAPTQAPGLSAAHAAQVPTAVNAGR